MRNKPVPEPEGPFDIAAVEGRYRKWFPDLTEPLIQGLIRYQTELVRFNKTVNLVSPVTAKTAESIHFADSIKASRLIERALVPNEPVYDFGSGNGFPGLVFAALYPNRKVILVDRDQRKLEFCKHVGAALELKNVSILMKGVEELPDGSVKNVMSRGFAPLQKALLIARKPVGKGGRFFHLKGDGWANELAALPSQLFSHWTPSLLGQYRIPETTHDMAVVQTEKIAD